MPSTGSHGSSGPVSKRSSLRGIGALVAAVLLAGASWFAITYSDRDTPSETPNVEGPSPATDEQIEADTAPGEQSTIAEPDQLASGRPDPETGTQGDAPVDVQTEIIPEVRQVIPDAEPVVQPGDRVERLPAPPLPVEPPRPVNLGIVVVESANRLDTRRGMVTLSGTQAVDPDLTCQLSDGRQPLCSVLARTAVRRFVGQRRVDCILGIRSDTADDHVTTCQIGDSDLAGWVIAQGWAYAAEGAPEELQEAERSARELGLGLWALIDR
ncbi:MAG: hypothetical protein AAF739_02650 [Pseudomonadota bacterium]